jgi:hypothetical protein
VASNCLFKCGRSGVKSRCDSLSKILLLAIVALLHRSNSHDFALLSQSSAVKPEHDRNGNHHSREAAEQSPSPLDAQVGEHLASKEWEASRDDGSEHDVGGYGGSGAIDHCGQRFVISGGKHFYVQGGLTSEDMRQPSN